MPDFKFERTALIRRPGAVIAGIDEAGRGPWAGPVVAAAVVFDIAKTPQSLSDAIDDSKKLSPATRERLCAELLGCPAVSVGIGRAEVEEIDRLNILNATFLAMARAVDDVGRPVDHALIDGNRAPPLRCTVEMLVKGRGLDRRQGDARPADARVGGRVPWLRLGDQRGLRHAGTPGGGGAPRHHAPSSPLVRASAGALRRRREHGRLMAPLDGARPSRREILFAGPPPSYS
jgi:hypothetical protein